MEVVSARSALLSNFEVLTLLKELESEQLARQKTAIRIKKEEEEKLALGVSEPSDPTFVNTLAQEEVCENLRTVEFEAIRYLSADYQPTRRQSPESIGKIVRGLSRFELTKAEKLQIVNLAPTEPVELYVIVEEIEDRFGDSMEDVLEVVRSSLTQPLFLPVEEDEPSTSPRIIHYEVRDEGPSWVETAVAEGGVEEEFDDTGTGAGVEGDLEMGDVDD